MNQPTKPSRTFSLALAIAAAGCASTPPPKELIDARAAYAAAEKGETAKRSPARLHQAKDAIELAERAFEDEPSADETRDRAYVALRTVELANAHARVAVAEASKASAEKDLRETERSQLSSAKKQLSNVKTQLEQEQRARKDAERTAKEALENLARMAQVKQETRGTVITISGAVLFPSGKSTLLPAAQSGLDNVVAALKSTPDRNVTVEGHTDSQGARSFNMDLASDRAQAVRSYLVSHGIPPEQIKAVGIGPDRPIADNLSADGRANNRRVEIIVAPAENK